MTTPDESPPESLDLGHLLDRAKAGDRTSQDELCKRFYARVERQVHHALQRDVRNGRSWLHARFSTSDIVQDTFQGVIRDLSGLQGRSEAAFGKYLTMVVRNRILDAVRFHQADRRDGRIGAAELIPEDLAGTGIDPAQAAANLETERAYVNALSKLPEREQLLVRARFEGSATFDELTEVLGYSSTTTTRRTFNRAKAQIAMKLEESLRAGKDSDA